MLRRVFGPLILSFLGILLAPSPLRAQVYRWVDERGTVRYSEGIDSVPSQFRSTAKPIPFPKSPPPPPPAEKPAGEKPPASADSEKKPAEPEKSPEEPKG